MISRSRATGAPESFRRLLSPSALDPLTPVFATDPSDRYLSPFLATLPKTPFRKSFRCHTCGPPPPPQSCKYLLKEPSYTLVVVPQHPACPESAKGGATCADCFLFLLIKIQNAGGACPQVEVQGANYDGRLFGAAGSAAAAAPRMTPLGTKVTRKSPNSSSRIPE